MGDEKLKTLLEDLGKPTMRGVRKCPKCGTLNGTRGISCKNKSCDVVFKEREKKRGHSADAVKIITGSTVQVFSVRLRDRGPDYRGFVQLPLVQDLDGNPAENVHHSILASAARCYVESCTNSRIISSQPSPQLQACSHIRAAIGCNEEAQPLTLKNSVLNSLTMSSEIKQAVWLLATETTGPLVQRVTKNIMVVKCKPNTKHPLGFLHFSFFEAPANRNKNEPHRFFCSCKAFKSLKASPSKEDGQKKCVHFYACICAFASDEKLAEEFQFYIDLDNLTSVPDDLLLVDVIETHGLEVDDEEVCDEEVLQVPDVETVPIGGPEESASMEVIIDDDVLLASEAKKPKLESLLTSSSLAASGSTLLSLSDSTSPQSASIVMVPSSSATASASQALTNVHSLVSIVSQPGSTPTLFTTTTPKKLGHTLTTTPAKAKNASTPKKIVDEESLQLSFRDWLGSVTERINQTMHYQFDGCPEPLVFHAQQKFFDCLQQRISTGSKKKRLPNSTTGFVRKDALPLGTFTKYTWHITSIFHVKQIFDTPQMPLEITRSFVENRDGTFSLYEAPKLKVDGLDNAQGKMPIRPFELKTYLKVGVTAQDQKDPTPFVIEWIPDILPKCRIGELRIKFEYGHQRNGQVEHRSQPSTSQSGLDVIHIQPVDVRYREKTSLT